MSDACSDVWSENTPLHALKHKGIIRPARGVPAETCSSASLAVFAYLITYACICMDFRHSNALVALLLGPGMVLVMAGMFLYVALHRFRRGKPLRLLVLSALGLIGGDAVGSLLGELTWRKHTAQYYAWKEMASYVNVDPGVDKGQAYMDAGVLYFKEDAFVQTKRALAFRNGATYCIAPILRSPLKLDPSGGEDNGFQLDTLTGFKAPKSGSVDFWAVGTDCCGHDGGDGINVRYTCGDAQSKIARSGLRILSGAERENYLLATQQWSASIGLPVRHPLFFTWTKDPLQKERDHYDMAWNRLWNSLPLVLLAAVLGSFMMAMTFKHLEID